MKFTKAQVAFIAEMLKEAKPENHSAIPAKTPLQEWEYTLFAMSVKMKEANPKFEAIRFLKAAGYEGNVMYANRVAYTDATVSATAVAYNMGKEEERN